MRRLFAMFAILGISISSASVPAAQFKPRPARARATRVIRTLRAERAYVEQCIRRAAPPDRPMQILEAGCGRKWFFDMRDVPYELTGVDLDAAALDARVTSEKDLHRAHRADLRTVELEPYFYDVIYSSYVLEHVSGAEQVLENFARWLRPGGIMIVRVPDRDSVQGFTARWTPFKFHVWYYKYIEGRANAGKPGYAPYPTVYDEVISTTGMAAFAERHGLKLLDVIGHGGYQRGRGVMRFAVSTYARAMSLLSLGRVHDDSADLTFILRKPSDVT
jgi:SAM-dependent methyltransferase